MQLLPLLLIECSTAVRASLASDALGMHPSMRTPRHRASKPSAAFTVGGALAAAFAVFVVFSLGRLWQASSGASGSGGAKTPQERAWAFRGGSVDTLVVYIFSATDLEYINNLNFFLKFGIREGDGAEYVIILQQDESGEVSLSGDLAQHSAHRQLL